MRLNLTIPWHKVWSIKSFYATPRDQFTWLKVMHRNLFVAGNGGAGDTACRACPQRENIEHLVRCSVIQADFWKPLIALMKAMGFPAPPSGEEAPFLLLGRLTDTTVVDSNQAGLMFIAWRCLYAAVVSSRVDGTPLHLDRAYNRVFQMTISRLKANGEKWLLWARKNAHTGQKSVIPEDKRERTVIKFSPFGDYTVSATLMAEYTRTKPDAR